MSKDRLKVGIFFNARPEQGGLYQYALTLVDCLHRFAPQYDYRFYQATLEPLPLQLSSDNWRIIELPRRGIWFRLFVEMLLMIMARLGVEIPVSLIPEYREIKRDKPDVMIYVKPTCHVFQWNYSAIFPIHDLQHRFQPQFPEVSIKGEYQRREYLYKHSIRSASAILTDSVTGKEDALLCYSHADAEKIFPLPHLAPTFRTNWAKTELVHEKYNLPIQYLFYPAAFWPHKNHEKLVRALSILANEKGASIPLVLAGSPRLEFDKIFALVNSLELRDIVHFIGYVPDDDMNALYQRALALVMPTFFGPTNIPVLEAWAAGCAVITSDVRGIREQVGDAGLLVDPKDERAIANAIWKIYQDQGTHSKLVERGKVRVAQWTPELFTQRLATIIDFAVNKNSRSKFVED
jgi:glycosyltransferase involved in cell wall biosynthesis